MNYQRLLSAALLALLILHTGAGAQTAVPLPRSAPEMQGVSSKGILQFLDAAAKSKNEFHSFMLLRHGAVVAEGWWNPYRPDLKHTMYSVSKSFTATAIGLAVSEKRLTVDDKVISFFPDQLPETVSPYLAQLRVKDLLSMSAGMEPDPTPAIIPKEENWVKAFLATPILHEPGTVFLYNSMCTYMLSAIIQKVTGEKLIDYLTPRLFQPLGISGMDWEADPRGINTGGWGLRVKTEDMARFGQLFLQKGAWNGRQVLPKEWVEAASTLKIVQHPAYSQAKRDSSDWEQGYCYQMWRCRHNAYRGDGAFGQYIVVMPEQDAVLVITSETADMQDELNLVWKYLLPALQPDKLPEDKVQAAALAKRLAALALPAPIKTKTPSGAKALSGKTFALAANEKNITAIAFQFRKKACSVAITGNAGTFPLSFGNGKWIFGQTAKLGPSLVGPAKAHFAGLPPSQVAGSYRWTDARTLELTLRYIDSPHTETMVCHFDQNKVSVDFMNSFEKGKKLAITGVSSGQ